MKVAGGTDISGRFGHKLLQHLPTAGVYAEDVDLDQFMVKFDNFGQDYLVSKTYGIVNCALTGKLPSR